jgi:hypothetical protein
VKALNRLINDPRARQNFEYIQEAMKYDDIFKGRWTFRTFTCVAAVTTQEFAHNLDFTPKDILCVHVSNSATVTWLHDIFNSRFIYFTTSAACTLRFFIGRYEENI